MFPPELCPFRKLILAARSIELLSYLQELSLQLSLLSRGLGCRGWQKSVQIPQLECVSWLRSCALEKEQGIYHSIYGSRAKSGNQVAAD